MRTRAQLVAIVGGSGAGKSRLSAELQRRLGTIAGRISLDDFYRDRSDLTLAQRARVNYDHPRAIDWNLFERAIRSCQAARPVSLPIYDFATHTRCIESRRWTFKPVCVVDGLWLLRRPAIRSLFDIRIFIDCPDSTRFARRLARDATERDRQPGAVREQFARVVAPMHDRFVAPQSRWADFVLGKRIGEQQIRTIVERIQKLRRT